MQTSNHLALHRWYHCQSCRVASWPFAGRILWSQAASLISERCLYYTTKSKKVNTPERLFSIFFRRRRMEARNGIGRSGCKAGRYHGPLLNAASISYRMRCGLDRRGLSVDGLNRRPDGGNFAMPQDPGENELRKNRSGGRRPLSRWAWSAPRPRRPRCGWTCASRPCCNNAGAGRC